VSAHESDSQVRGELLYEPTSQAFENSRMGQFLRRAEKDHGLQLAHYRALWEWSVERPSDFWTSVIDFFDLDIDNRTVVLGDREPPRAEWMPGSRLSYAEHALRQDIDGPALVGISQTRQRVALTMDELRDAVARCRAGLLALGVRRDDRVAAYLPNIPETVVAMLATASLGAVWASCPPEFGAKAVIDRFSQIEPTVLLAVDGYRYGSKAIDRRQIVEAIRAGLPTLQHTVLLDYLHDAGSTTGITSWEALLSEHADLEFERVSFDHPLYVLFSSGTTGLPKAIVHGHGGILLEHAKALGLHNDVSAGDRYFWHSTTGWMVWNYAVSALMHGASLVCFDGDPAFPRADALWQLVADERVTYFGTSAGHIGNSADAELTPGRDLDLSALRGVGSTGSPLSAAGYRWIYEAVGDDIVLSSVSGGTDICSAFVGGSPLSPVRAGEIAAPTLGANVAALDKDGRRLFGEFGELSILSPMPSMPVALWGDDGTRLMETYFSKHQGVWSHGDWALFREDLSCVITGRSDATLNRGGVRLGTSDFYSVLDKFPDVEDSLVVHLEDPDAGPGELVLLVALAESVDEVEFTTRVRAALREEMSPRHVPDRLIRLNHLPRTLTGKRLEKPVKKILLGADPDSVVSRGSITFPDALDILRAQSLSN